MALCLICQSTHFKTRYKIQAWNIQECLKCGFSWIDPLPNLDHRNQFYSESKVIERNTREKNILIQTSAYFKRQAKHWLPIDKNDLFSQRIKKIVPLGGSILDIGCGDGSFLERLKNDYACSGIEISDYLGNKAKARGKLDVYIGDYLYGQKISKVFDAITMISLIEHLWQPKAALLTCYDLLKSNGQLLLKTVNYTCVNRYIMGKQWTGFRPPDHMVYFSPKTLETLLTGIGFSKVKTHANPFNDNMYCEAMK